MTRRPGASVVASPVLVGAVTVLVTIVAVFLAYNANQGLPFVPTYDVHAEIPGGENLVKGNEVRLGGFRIGLIDEIKPKTVVQKGQRQTIAVVRMKLDKVIEPLPRDTQIFVRPRSALGLKYIEVTPGRSQKGYSAGDTIPLANARTPVEFDDVFSTFDARTRSASRTALTGFGNAFAGRGQSLNQTIAALSPFFLHLRPVMATLADPDTQLDEFFKQIGRASAQVAPVAKTNAQLFVNMADTFDAFSRCAECLRQTIEKSPPTLDASISSFRVQRPFLEDFADVSAELRPPARELPRALPALNDAFRVGQPVVERTPTLNRLTGRVFQALDDLVQDPNTLAGLKDLRTLTAVTRPLLEFVGPYQTVCNYWNSWWTPLGEHISQDTRNGTTERILLKNAPNDTQDNRVNAYESDRPTDIPSNLDPQHAVDQLGDPLIATHAQPYAPAIDAQGNADCQVGQSGYLNGPLVVGGRYPASTDPARGGGSHVVGEPDTPGLAGPTWQKLDNHAAGFNPKRLKDVP
jgi:phospholipid/cholesterol/gamma-HCH transport system substrate-binding protein